MRTHMLVAITREISRSLQACELTHLARTGIDLPLAYAQHERYRGALEELGCRVLSLPAADELPDAVFVEDTAVVLDEVAIVTRPGAASRRGETTSIAEALRSYRPVVQIEEPGTLEGGDVLRLGRRIFAGASGRSNQPGIAQLASLVAPYGYSVTAVPVSGCLHLKSAVTEVAPDLLLANPAWVDPSLFSGFAVLETDPSEPYAANALLILPGADRNGPRVDSTDLLGRKPDAVAAPHSSSGGVAIYPSSFPATRRRLEARGIAFRLVDVSELMKAEGAVTCCSLVFEA